MPGIMLANAGGSSGAMSTIMSGISDVSTAVNTVWSTVVGNPYLVFCLAASVLAVGIGIFSRIKNVVH